MKEKIMTSEQIKTTYMNINLCLKPKGEKSTFRPSILRYALFWSLNSKTRQIAPQTLETNHFSSLRGSLPSQPGFDHNVNSAPMNSKFKK